MRILGIDPGTGITGWGVIENEQKSSARGGTIKLVDYGVIKTSSGLDAAMRLKDIYDEMTGILEKYSPDEVAIEDLFFFKNQKTVIKVGQARGVVIVACVNKDLPVFDYTPLQVKQAITGYGRAEKKQMQKMISLVLHMPEVPKSDDAADALSVAVCHLHSR